MTVKLVAMTQPIEGTAEEFIIRAARVSNPASAAKGEGNARLMAYLIREKHWSPLEMVSATLEVQTTRDIGRQMLRHRSFSFQEFSSRYSEMPNDPVWRTARMQDHENRQNSIETDDLRLHDQFYGMQHDIWHRAQAAYQAALAKGIAKEQARALLPEGLTPTTLYMAGTLRSWLHYIDLRDGNGTQAEHADIARACRAELTKHFPMTMEATDVSEL